MTSPAVYAAAIQYQLIEICGAVPVYANFNRNFATEPTFVTWALRNIGPPVYTGQTQSNVGIDTPIFQVSVFAQSFETALTLSNDILQALNGFSGQIGGEDGLFVAKIETDWLMSNYDNEVKLNEVFLDCSMYVPT